MKNLITHTKFYSNTRNNKKLQKNHTFIFFYYNNYYYNSYRTHLFNSPLFIIPMLKYYFQKIIESSPHLPSLPTSTQLPLPHLPIQFPASPSYLWPSLLMVTSFSFSPFPSSTFFLLFSSSRHTPSSFLHHGTTIARPPLSTPGTRQHCCAFCLYSKFILLFSFFSMGGWCWIIIFYLKEWFLI